MESYDTGAVQPFHTVIRCKEYRVSPPKWHKLMPEIPNFRFTCGNSNIRYLFQILAAEIQTNFNNSPRQNVPKLCWKAKKTHPQNTGCKVSMQLKGLAGYWSTCKTGKSSLAKNIRVGSRMWIKGGGGCWEPDIKIDGQFQRLFPLLKLHSQFHRFFANCQNCWTVLISANWS
jgi:hypothetical protein